MELEEILEVVSSSMNIPWAMKLERAHRQLIRLEVHNQRAEGIAQ
jgi:hypothetical protein